MCYGEWQKGTKDCKVDGANSTQSKEAYVANAREGRLNECDSFFSTIESQTIYGEGGIQVAKVGAIDVNKIQQLWCIWQHIFKI